jgi:hypothetical protein
MFNTWVFISLKTGEKVSLKTIISYDTSMIILGSIWLFYLIFIILILTDTYPEKWVADEYKE